MYEAKRNKFTAWNGSDSLRDGAGRNWKVDEGQLTGPDGTTLKRLPAHGSFWFG